VGTEEALDGNLNTGLKEAAPSSEPRDLLGVEVANFRVERRLGRGGMADVYLLRHQRLPSTCVAMKVLRGAKLGPGEWFDARHTGLCTGAEPLDALLAERFKQEAHVAAALGAPRVVAPLDIGQLDDGTPYILMEYVSGRSLEERLAAEGALPVRHALDIALAVADTMARAHARGIVHRDLKPSNIMLSDDGLVRLLDFGVARVSGTLSLVHTTERAVLGTPGYIAPEVLSGYEADESSDVFSLGVTLFKMLTNTLPFPARTSLATAEKLLSGAAPPLASRRSPALDPVPADVEELVQRMLAREPGSRPTMATLAAAWRTEATAPERVSAKARGWRWRAAVAFAVVLGFALVQARASTEARPERLRKANEHLMVSLAHALPAPVSGKAETRAPQARNAASAPPAPSPSASARPPRRSRRAPAHQLKVVDPVDWMEQ
jgi:serine/threonine protein kinase